MLLAVDVGNTQTLAGVYSGRGAAARVAHRHRARGHRRRAGRPPRPDPAPARRQPRRAGRHGRRLGGARPVGRLPVARRGISTATRSSSGRACARACRSPSTTPTSWALTASPTRWRHRRHGGPCIVVDFGTATTFDVISEAGEYLGGVIAPGIETSLDRRRARRLAGQDRPRGPRARHRQVDRREHALGRRLHRRDGRRGRRADQGRARPRRAGHRHGRARRRWSAATRCRSTRTSPCSPSRGCGSSTS